MMKTVKRKPIIVFVLTLLCFIMVGCSGLDKTDKQIVDSVINNDSQWTRSDTFNMNFTSYEGNPAIRVWNGGSGTSFSYYVEYCTYTIDYENNSISLVDSYGTGVGGMPDSMRFGNEYPSSSSEEAKREYVESRYKVWKKSN